MRTPARSCPGPCVLPIDIRMRVDPDPPPHCPANAISPALASRNGGRCRIAAPRASRALRPGRVAGAVAEAVGPVVRALAAAHVELGRDRRDELDRFEAGALVRVVAPGLIRAEPRNCTSDTRGLPQPSRGTARSRASAVRPPQPAPCPAAAPRFENSSTAFGMLVPVTNSPLRQPVHRCAAARARGSSASSTRPRLLREQHAPAAPPRAPRRGSGIRPPRYSWDGSGSDGGVRRRESFVRTRHEEDPASQRCNRGAPLPASATPTARPLSSRYQRSTSASGPGQGANMAPWLSQGAPVASFIAVTAVLRED